MADFPILPEGTSLVPGGLQTTYGAVIVSIIISCYLLGILTVQVYMYYTTFTEDPTYIKAIVGIVCVLDAAQLASCVDFAWWYVITNWGNVLALQNIRTTFGLEVLFGTLVVAIVEAMFLRRIYIMSKQSLLFTIPIAILILVQLTFGIIGAHFGLTPQPFADAVGGSFASLTIIFWLGCGVVADVLIALLLCIYLSNGRTGFERTDGILKKLIFYTMNTCLLTSMAAVANIITFFAMRDNFIHVAFNMLLCKLFSNSLLASLNTRKVLRNDLRGASKGTRQQSSRSDPQITFDVGLNSTRGDVNGGGYAPKAGAGHMYPPPSDAAYDRKGSLSNGVRVERTVTGPGVGMVDLKDGQGRGRGDSLYWAQ